jgi:propionyl-CoA synthetase
MGIEKKEIKPGSSAVAMPGYDVRIFSEQGEEIAPGQMGNIVIKLPMPPSCLPSLWGNDQRFIDTYLSKFEGYYLSGDAGYKDDDGYLWIMSRIDDVINVAGHRLSTGAIEEVLSGHQAVAECAVFGVGDSLKGQLPLGLIVLKAGIDRKEEEIIEELVQRVRDHIGPVAAFKMAKVVQRLPKTRSGKILRSTMASIADGTNWKMPATIDDPDVLNLIKEALLTLGYAKP